MQITKVNKTVCCDLYNRNQALTFRGKIIDIHAHIGYRYGDYYDKSALDKFINTPLTDGDTIESVIVSNLSPVDKPDIFDEITGKPMIKRIILI